MTWAQAVKGAHRINQQAAYGTQARHLEVDGQHLISVTAPDDRHLGTFATIQDARTAAGL